eukprot:gene26108-28515_t
MLQKPEFGPKTPAPSTTRWNIVRGDFVEVIQGPQQGQRGKVKAVLRDTNRIIVDGVNLRKRYIRASQPGESGRTVIMPVSVHYSKVRVSKLSGHIIPKPDFSQFRKPRSLGKYWSSIHRYLHADTPVEEVEKVTFTDYEKYLPFIYASKAAAKLYDEETYS